MQDTEIANFKAGLRGPVIEPKDEGYDEARALYNGMIDKRPRIIARCADVADVISAVNFGRDCDLLIAVRGGGHNGPGLGSCDVAGECACVSINRRRSAISPPRSRP